MASFCQFLPWFLPFFPLSWQKYFLLRQKPNRVVFYRLPCVVMTSDKMHPGLTVVMSLNHSPFDCTLPFITQILDDGNRGFSCNMQISHFHRAKKCKQLLCIDIVICKN